MNVQSTAKMNRVSHRNGQVPDAGELGNPRRTVVVPVVVKQQSVAEKALLEARKAILDDANMTKDLEEQMDNIVIAENIATRRSSTISNEEPLATTKHVLNVSPIRKSSHQIIEPLSTAIIPGTSKLLNSTSKAAPQRGETISGNRGPRLQKITRYQSLMTEVDPMKRTRGSITSSSDEETAVKLELVDPVNFSSTGASIICNATQTPEEMNSSDSDHTDEELTVEEPPPVREPSSSESSGDSTSETEEWDSEADTHTSASEDETETKPKASYYQVIDTAGARPAAEKSKSPPARSLKDQFMTSLPWMRRPTFTSMQFPTTNAGNHPRREMFLPSSQSFPQEFFHMVSNPFFSTSLHDAYRQACAFKEWYEANFPDQVGNTSAASVPGDYQENHSSAATHSRTTAPQSPQTLASQLHSKRYSK